MLLRICVYICLDALLTYIRNVTHKQNRFFSWSCNSHFKGSGTYVTIDGTTTQGEQLLTGTVIAQTSLAHTPYAQYTPTFRSVLRRLRVTGDIFRDNTGFSAGPVTATFKAAHLCHERKLQ